jgi:glycosyltransferase involved in cell wall biosynthesis
LIRWIAITRRILRDYRPDVLHSHYINEAGWLGAAAGWHPLVITAWGSDVYRAPVESRAAARLNPWAVRKADYITCDSAHQSRVIHSWRVPEEKIGVIGWGVDTRRFHPEVDGRPMRERLKIPLTARVLLSPRQWLANSNIPAVIAAHSELSSDVYLLLKRIPEFERGAETEIERAIAASPAADRIRVMGRLAPSELPALYAAADVVVSLCSSDGTPVSVLESMAVGRPVVALRLPSLEEWVVEPGGRLVDTVRAGDVAGAVGSFLLDRGLRERAAETNVAIITTRADRDAELGRMSRVYERLIASAGVDRRSHA